MPGRRLFNINFNIGGSARTSVLTARAVNSASSRAEGSRSRAALRLLTPTASGMHTPHARLHILSGGGIVAQRARPGCWHGPRPRRSAELVLHSVRSLPDRVSQALLE